MITVYIVLSAYLVVSDDISLSFWICTGRYYMNTISISISILISLLMLLGATALLYFFIASVLKTRFSLVYVRTYIRNLVSMYECMTYVPVSYMQYGLLVLVLY